jgi:hypothetical protein
MSDKAIFGAELDNLLLSWQKKYGTEKTNKARNIYYDIKDMRTALNALVNTFISIGYDQADLQSILLSDKIQRTVTPHRYDGKLAEWRLMIDKQWKSTINDFFPDTRLQEAKILDSVAKPTVVLEEIKQALSKESPKERPSIDKDLLKNVIMPEYIESPFDPDLFLKEGKKNE